MQLWRQAGPPARASNCRPLSQVFVALPFPLGHVHSVAHLDSQPRVPHSFYLSHPPSGSPPFHPGPPFSLDLLEVTADLSIANSKASV